MKPPVARKVHALRSPQDLPGRDILQMAGNGCAADNPSRYPCSVFVSITRLGANMEDRIRIIELGKLVSNCHRVVSPVRFLV